MNQERRKNEIMTKLATIQSQTNNEVWAAWIEQAVEFIKEQR